MSETITMKKNTMWGIVVGVLAVLLIVSITTGGFGMKSSGTGTNNNAGAQPTVPTGIANVNAEDYVDDDPFLGDDNAPVTIVEFSDFQCPYCSRFRDQTFDLIKENYIDTGKVRFVYRDFPLSSIHPMAQKAAEASECADEQDKFWEYHDKLFAGQSSFSVDSFKQWAKDLGLDATKFNSCLDSGKYTNEVKSDLADATASGGSGTPYFLIGNTQLSGAYPFDEPSAPSDFKRAIESQL